VLADENFIKLWKEKIATGASPGCTGFTGDHGLPLLKDPDCLRGLAYLVELIRNGLLDLRCKTYLLSCPLIAVPKPHGGVRPIVMGETLYKVAGVHALSEISNLASDILEPHQFATLPGGSETASLLLKACLETQTGITLDIRNAYNESDRAYMLERVFEQPDLAPIWRLVHWAYSTYSDLLIFNPDGSICDVISSQRGPRQGDTLATVS